MPARPELPRLRPGERRRIASDDQIEIDHGRRRFIKVAQAVAQIDNCREVASLG